MLVQASIGSFFDAIGSFFDSLSRVGWIPLLLGAASFIAYLSLRARAFFHTLRAAYPTERIAFRRVWGAYIAAYGFNNVIPARGGDVIKLFLVKGSIPHATYPAVGAARSARASSPSRRTSPTSGRSTSRSSPAIHASRSSC